MPNYLWAITVPKCIVFNDLRLNLFSKIYYYFIDRNTYEEEFLNLIVEEDKRKIARDRIEKMMGKHDLLNVYKEGPKETLGQMIIRQR